MLLEPRSLDGMGGDCTVKLHAEIDLMHDAHVVVRMDYLVSLRAAR
jgi:hypothetical protein